jgi:predicted nicotinamide N-methyase
VPEITLHLADDPFPLWELTKTMPYWAFAWPGGQALARYVLDHPELVAGRRVLDLASGSGLVAIAAALAGATTITATDIDPLALQAIELNTKANNTKVTARCIDLLDTDAGNAETILAGDVCYDRTMTQRVLPFLARAATRGIQVLVGDPARPHFPKTGFQALATYPVPATSTLEANNTTQTTIWQRNQD